MFKLFDFIKSDLIRYALGKYVSFFIQYITNKISSWQSAFRFEQTDGAIRLVSYYLWLINQNEALAKGTKFGYGLYIGYNDLVFVNPTAVIGDTIKLSRFVTIGLDEGHAAKTRNIVYDDSSTYVVESVKIGNNVAIKEKAVVQKIFRAMLRRQSIIAGV